MTDEEMARLYLIEKYGLRKDLETERIQHSILSIEYSTYLAGLKAGEKLGFEKGIKAKVNTTTISDCTVKPVWHKVADGDLPKDEDWKWCVSYRGYYYVAKYEEMFGCWTNQEYSEVMQPYAWKEIIPPKQEE